MHGMYIPHRIPRAWEQQEDEADTRIIAKEEEADARIIAIE